MLHNSRVTALALAMVMTFSTREARAIESIEFVAEHLPEIAMDNRYATLPLWNACDACFGINAGYARTHSQTLALDGPMVSFSMMHTVGERHRLTAFAFFDDLAFSGGLEHRPLNVLFANPPLTLPADAEFTGLDGTARDVGVGLALNGTAHWNWLPWFEWSAGAMWQQFRLSDYRFDYRILEGPDADTTGVLDYSATYTFTSPFIGAVWARTRGNWGFAPHVLAAWPYPRRAVEGRIIGPGFELTGDQAANGHGAHFGDPSMTIGFNVTYEPWHFTVDVGSTITQALVEPRIHEGVQHNLVLSAYWTF